MLLGRVDASPPLCRHGRVGDAARHRTGTAPAQATVRGVIVDEHGASVAGAEVRDAAGRRVVSSAGGAFAALAAGRIAVRRLGFTPLDTVLGAGTGYRLVLQPSAPMLARLVIHPGFAGSGPSVQAPTVTLSRRDLERLPQPGEDLFRAFARLPGVAAGEVSARLRVRGGAADELLYQFDGAELPDPFHLPDLDAALSMIDLRLVGGVDLHAGTLPLELGQRSGGALVFPLPAFDGTPSTTSASLSLTGVRVAQHLRLGARTDADMIVRRGYLDLVLDALGESDGLTPRYGDAYARVRWYGARDRMSAHLLHGDDYLRYAQDDDLQSTARYRTAVGWLTTEHERGALGSQHTLRIGGEWRPAESRFDLLRLRDTLTVVRGELQRRTDTTRLLDALETHRSGGWVGVRSALPHRLTQEVGARFDATRWTGEALLAPRAA